ncbi:acetyl-CoA carboxylase biotin carboxyl carrier protein subunit [Burkholderia oklahomensis]|uniref:Biotin-requiring enzyme family protein n=1 Tax=Burkholderia oklahomensis TaxID=342113 RepID=A0AAI8FN81_9BURK|nr:acetyl-CoA carboxylase biotin carboxyl carrier protein subunit [Burkholderia oklahomensis]AIO66585.1 biotin-requiring enzyme family protein [Burkholderia oklahomensis]AJX33002.1 biotin-requiring enzyme family protein [Burkholderia oklahomensis C6786]SUW55527.1 2-oxoglutarate carboxylase large subunit [Burkholderia oklahomensis]
MSIPLLRTTYTGALSDAPEDEPPVRIDVQTLEPDVYRATFGDGHTLLLRLISRESLPDGVVRLVAEADGAHHDVLLTPAARGGMTLDYAGIHRAIGTRGARRGSNGTRRGGGRAAHAAITAPMPARIAEILVAESDVVDEGAPVVRIEAMKMLMTLTAPRRCRIETVHVAAAVNVEAGALLVSVADADPA